MITYKKGDDGAVIEVLSETVCFRIDQDFNSSHALPILAALQAYVRDCLNKTLSWNKLYKQNRQYDLNLIIVCSRPEMLAFLCRHLEGRDGLKNLQGRESGIGINVSSLDYYVDITFQKVYDIIKVGNLHVHQGIGILIGSASDSLAAIEPKETIVDSGSLLVIDDLNCAQLLHELNESGETQFGKIVWAGSDLRDSIDLDESAISLIASFEAVIGERGFATYAASCLRKPVLELNYSEKDFTKLTQWSNPHYIPLIVSSDFLSTYPTTLKQAVLRLWQQVVIKRESAITPEPVSSIIEG